MGILYNRLIPETFLLPYSNQTKIVTYATVDNFNASSSTWGEGIAPIVRDSGSWHIGSLDNSVILADTSTTSIFPVSVHNTAALRSQYESYAFTIYEVLYITGVNTQHDVDERDYNTRIYRGNASIGYINDKLFLPEYSSNRNYYYTSCVISNSFKPVYCNLSAMNKLHITVAAYEDLMITPEVGDNYFLTNVFLRCNNATRSFESNPHSYYENDIDSIEFNGNFKGNRYYKFIAIVAEKESSEVIANNVAFLKNYYSVEY